MPSLIHLFRQFFLEMIVSSALKDYDWKVSIGGRTKANLRFTGNIDAIAEEEQAIEALVKML